MVTITDGVWIADLGTMTCWNCRNNIIVSFERSGKTLVGKIYNMPPQLFEKWAAEPYSEGKIKNAVMEAKEVFSRAYMENAVENYGLLKNSAAHP